MNWLLVLPLLIPLLTAAITLLAWRRVRVQRVLGVSGPAAILVVGVILLIHVNAHGIAVTQAAAWPAPFGITLVADLFSGTMVVLAGATGLAVAVYSLADIDEPRESFGYYSLLHVLLMGLCGGFLTGDLFNLYVMFEVMLIASFVLLALGGERHQLLGAIQYVTLNLLASAFFLAALGIVYGMAGTLNMADLARAFAELDDRGNATTVGVLLLIAFGIKAAVFPLFFWLPAAYPTPPVAVSAIFAGLLTEMGVYAAIRTFTLIFSLDTSYTHWLMLVVAGLTMFSGAMGAICQKEIRRILSFLHISHIGYPLMGLGLAGVAGSPDISRLALAGSVFYIIHHVFAVTNLFLISGVMQRLAGSSDLDRLGGLYNGQPRLAVLFMISSLSLAGVPPLSGFFAKLVLVKAGLVDGRYAIVVVALAVGVLTMVATATIWSEAFWGKRPHPSQYDAERCPVTGHQRIALMLPIVTLAGITILVGLAAEPVLDLSLRTADQLIERDAYLQAVMGKRS